MRLLQRLFGRSISSDNSQRVQRAIQAFLHAPTWVESERIVEKWPELLTDAADTALEQLAKTSPNPLAIEAIAEERALLRRCRDIGIRAAFSEKHDSPVHFDTPQVFQSSRSIAQQHYHRYRQTSSLAALDGAISAWDHILAHTAFPSSDITFRLATIDSCAGAYLDRYQAQGQRTDLDHAITLWQCALATAPVESPIRSEILSHLGLALRDRHFCTGAPIDLGKAITACQEAADAAPQGSSTWAGALNNLGLCLRDRFNLAGAIADLDHSISAYRQSLTAFSVTSPHWAAVHNNLGLSLHHRYERNSDVADLNEAVVAYEKAVNATPAGALYRAGYLNNLGLGLRSRYARSGDANDLLHAVSVCEEAVAATPVKSPNRPRHLISLGNVLHDRYAQKGDQTDLDRAIAFYQQAAASGSSDWAAAMDGLGSGLRDRYLRSGKRADLDEALNAYRKVLNATPAESSDRALRLNNLGIGLHTRYEYMGALSDLDRAINVHQEAVNSVPVGAPDRAGYLSNLGAALRDRYVHTGSLADLDQAIAYHEESVTSTPVGAPDRAGYLANLGVCYWDRYARSKDTADLDQAIDYWEQALAAPSVGSSDRRAILNNLGAGLDNRYARTKALADINHALAVWDNALKTAPAGSPDRIVILNNKAAGLHARYVHDRAPIDLDQAIMVYQEVVRASPAGADRAGYSNNLGAGLRDRYARSNDPTDLEYAITNYERAVSEAPANSPNRASYLNNLGNALRDRYAHSDNAADLERAVAVYEQAMDLLESRFAASPVAFKLGQQREWAGLYARLVAARLQRAALPNPGDARRRALELAEATKSRLLTEGLARLDLPAPTGADPALIAREHELLGALTDLDSADLAAVGRTNQIESRPAPLNHAQQRQELLDELEDIWRQIEILGGEAGDYVALRRGRALTWNDLASLAQQVGSDTALLSLFTTAQATHLFILRAGWAEPQVATLDTNTLDWGWVLPRLEREVRSSDFAGALPETWDAPLRRLLAQALPHLGGARRIVFAPQAAGHLVPWDVALSRLGWGGSLVTLPALGLLPRLLARPASFADHGALVVGNPLQGQDPGDLPDAEEEARAVGRMLGVEPLIGAKATREEVLKQLDEAATVHLATHAHFDADSPLDSGVALADGLLTAREIVAHRLRADLVVLSACQTGVAGSLGGDELAGLAQAFFYAGAQALVVSLWPVNDPATATLMTSFYQARRKGAAPDVALRQAMESTRQITKWSSPHYWGPFVFMGDWR